MKREINKIKKVLRDSQFVKEMIEFHNSLNNSEKIDFESWIEGVIITNREGCIGISNETEIELCQLNYSYEMVDSLSKEFEKAGFNIEYSYGAFELYKESN